MKGVCRVCLTTAEDHITYRVVNKTLEHTYDVISRVKLQRADWPTTLCCVCVSQLRRCRRFIETVRESNDALEQWYQNHTHTDWKFTEHPLFSLTTTIPQNIDVSPPQVKEESIEIEHILNNTSHDTIPITEEIKEEFPSDNYEVETDPIQISNEENYNIEPPEYEMVKRGIKRSMSDIEDNVEDSDLMQEDDIKIDTMVHDVEETVPSSSKIGKNRAKLDQKAASRSHQPLKRIKFDEHTTGGPAIKKRKHNTARQPVNTVAVPVQFSCPHCTFTTNIKSNLKQHLMTHTGVKPFACNECNYKFIRKSSLKRHLFTHTGIKSFQCDKCDFKCIVKSELKKHSMIHNGDMPFVCDKCDYKSKRKNNLEKHLSIHSREKKFACDKCDYKSNNSHDFKNHVMTHTGEKPFVCDKCDYRCIAKRQLKIHSMIHNGDMPFVCDKCNYKSNIKTNFVKHLSVHSGEKKFACDKCDFKCSRSYNLKTHVMTHTGEKPFVCDKCDFKCIQKTAMKLHSMTHTKPFMCDVCGHKCSTKKYLSKHLSTHGINKI